MITEDYCSYEVARLLKEKGFDEPCRTYWDNQSALNIRTLFYSVEACKHNNNEECSAPTHQMVMKWLREVHNIFIEISVDEMLKDEGYQWAVYDNITKEIKPYAGWGGSYEEACEEALKYVLENLI